MSYQGFGYSPYQYLPGGQNSSYSSSLRQIPATSSSPSLNIQQTDRSYAQQGYEWQGQGTTDIQSQSTQQQPQPDNWSSTNPSHNSYGYQQQQQSTYHSSNAVPSIASRQTQQIISPSLKDIPYGSALEPIAIHNSAAADSRSNTPLNVSYQPDSRTQTRSPATIPIDRPNSAQRSRTAAASAMTALSSSIPPPRASSQYTATYETPLSNLVSSIPGSSPLQNDQSYPQQPTKQQYNRVSTTTSQPNMARQQKSQMRDSYSPAMSTPPTSASAYSNRSTLSQRNRPTGYNAAQRQPTVSQSAVSSSSYMSSTSENQAAHATQQQPQPPPQPQSYPSSNFIDPSQIYNPYYQEYQKKKAAEAEAETERAKQKEIEKERKQGREEREREREKEREAREKEVEKEREQAVQAEIRQKLEAANAAARSQEGRGQIDNVKPRSGRNPGPKPKKHNTSQEQAQGALKKHRRPRKPRPENFTAATNAAINSASMPVSAPQAQPTAPHTNQTPTQAPSEEEDDEDLEMKLMMEKMRKLKSKNPAKFARLFGNLDEQEPEPAPPQIIEEHGSARASVSVPHTSAPVNVSNDSGAAPDRGKFPAPRRKRKSKGKDVDNKAHSSPISYDAEQPGPSSQPEPNNDEVTAQKAGNMQINKIIDTEPAPLPPAETDSAKKEPSKAATIWPEEKRIALAQAAASYIDEVLVNAKKGKKCPPEMVLGLIDRNPTYTDLCGMLESRGYTLNRVHFAKHLIKAVPELTNTSGRPPTRPNPPSSRVPTLVPISSNLPPRTSYSSTYTPTLSKTGTTSVPPVSAPPAGTVGPQVLHNQTGSPPTSSTAPPKHEQFGTMNPPPASVPPENRIPGFLGSVPPPPPRPQSALLYRIQGPGPARPHAHPSPKVIKFGHSMGGPKPSLLAGKLKPKHRVPAPPAHVPAPGSKEALAKKRTFAEIVDLSLLSDDDDMPPPPKEPRLNGIPDGYMEVDPHAPSLSAATPEAPQAPEAREAPAVAAAAAPAKTLDLSQYRMPNPDAAANKTLRKRTDIIKPLNKAEALKTRYYNPKTIARDILIATGRHPTERPLNFHLEKLRENFFNVENTSDLRTFRWDVVDPGGPPPPEVELVTPISRPPAITVREYQKTPGRLPNQLPRDLTTKGGASEAQASSSRPRPSQFPHTPSQLRISHTVNSDDSSPQAQQDTSLMSATPPIPGPRRRGRPPGAKKKPRLADRVEVAIPSGAAASRSANNMYSCQWKDCNAQLHNLQTLRKHITRLHISEGKGNNTKCLWDECSFHDDAMTRDELLTHLELKHLSRIAWTRGEGPGSVRSDQLQNIDDWLLNDSNGRAMIPKATTKGNRPSLIFPTAYHSIKSFYETHRCGSDKAKAQEVLYALETKQMRVGLGMGRGGCTFMNEKRQDTVVASESVFEIVPEEDGNV
ncbi:hypothetical protein AJ79_03007 [Helicocarpus griseus UAMH5409]|uniref:C2H2-type domain-containing protein n=1 Tax=Helicocarpus griseus UAMH5409 TaxID=1447875 RepID=A0A2B7XRW8_9EURO|nr:hypothetical protein AJ79_03007 [Helicocarpus griseus UAMH5409]